VRDSFLSNKLYNFHTSYYLVVRKQTCKNLSCYQHMLHSQIMNWYYVADVVAAAAAVVAAAAAVVVAAVANS
jgi:negative regulator of genetic competence, sporulation and motility